MKRNKERQRVSLQEPNDNPHGRRPDHSARTRRRAQRTRPRIRRRIPATPVVHTRRRRQSDNKPDRSRKTNRGRSTRHKNNATTSRRQTSPQNVLPTLVPIRPQYASISFFSCVFFLILNCTSLPSLSRTWIWQRQREHTTTRNMQRRQRTRDNQKTSSGCETSLQQKNHMQVHAHSHQRDMDGRSKPSEREREEYSLEMAAPPPTAPKPCCCPPHRPCPLWGRYSRKDNFKRTLMFTCSELPVPSAGASSAPGLVSGVPSAPVSGLLSAMTAAAEAGREARTTATGTEAPGLHERNAGCAERVDDDGRPVRRCNSSGDAKWRAVASAQAALLARNVALGSRQTQPGGGRPRMCGQSSDACLCPHPRQTLEALVARPWMSNTNNFVKKINVDKCHMHFTR